MYMNLLSYVSPHKVWLSHTLNLYHCPNQQSTPPNYSAKNTFNARIQYPMFHSCPSTKSNHVMHGYTLWEIGSSVVSNNMSMLHDHTRGRHHISTKRVKASCIHVTSFIYLAFNSFICD